MLCLSAVAQVDTARMRSGAGIVRLVGLLASQELADSERKSATRRPAAQLRYEASAKKLQPPANIELVLVPPQPDVPCVLARVLFGALETRIPTHQGDLRRGIKRALTIGH